MNNKKYKIMIIPFFILLILIVCPKRVYAGLQANKDVASLVGVGQQSFFQMVREMEADGGTLGKSSVINSTTGLESEANGIDCHMISLVEWNSVAILTISDYGYIENGTNNSSTTGNDTGIFQMSNNVHEWICTKARNDGNNGIDSFDRRYRCFYGGGNNVLGWQDWYGATVSSSAWWNQVRDNTGIFGGITQPEGPSSTTTSRAVVVCGEGL